MSTARKPRLASLFETRRRIDPKLAVYPTVAAHLDAAVAGKKGLSLFSIGRLDELGRREHLELFEQAFRRRLVVVLHGEREPGVASEGRWPSVFVARPEELWRIPAWIALHDTGAWSAAAEAHASLLLGYTAAERARWIAAWNQRGSSGRPVYALLTRAQRARTASLGMRCLGSPAELDGMNVFVDYYDRGVARDALARLPAGVTLARIGLRAKLLEAVFGSYESWKRGVIEARLTKRLAARVNASLRANVELLTARGWR